ncbi:MAG: hemerythrin domain-containing protein [Bacteroidota bacterium]
MEELTPIKRHKAMVSFSKDHHFGLLLVWKIRQGLNKNIEINRISQYVLFFFTEDLIKHFKDEEALLFSELPKEDLLRKMAESEHQNIYRLVRAIEENKNSTSLLLELADALEKHIRFEERSLFNHLQSTIGEQALEVIEKRISNGDGNLDAKWEDHFWTSKN